MTPEQLMFIAMNNPHFWVTEQGILTKLGGRPEAGIEIIYTPGRKDLEPWHIDHGSNLDLRDYKTTEEFLDALRAALRQRA